MEPSREDVSIAIRSALLQKGLQQRFSLLILVIISIGLLFLEKVEVAPINYVRSAVKDAIYRGSQVISLPNKGIENIFGFTREHINLYADYNRIKTENRQLKNKISNSNSDFLKTFRASFTDFTIGKPCKLKDVFSKAGTPVFL